MDKKIIQIERITKKEFFEKLEEIISNKIDEKLQFLQKHTEKPILIEDLFSRKQAAAFLQMSDRTLDLKIKEGKIKSIRDGKYIKIKESELIKYLDNYEQ